MREWKLPSTVPVLFAVIFITLFGWVMVSLGKSSAISTSPVGGYSIAVSGRDAFLVDTRTGCVWHKTTVSVPLGLSGSTIPVHGNFRLISVQGIIQISSTKEHGNPPQAIPEKCMP